MSYTRRSLLRSAGLASLGLAGAPLSTLAAVSRQPGPTKKPEPLQPHTPPTPFNGVRAFFAGAWIFMNAGNGNMYAITRYMAAPGPPHIFPYGQYQGNNFNHAPGRPSLTPNTNANPYIINVTGSWSPAKDVKTLFQTTQQTLPLVTIQDKNTKVNWATKGLIVIQLPIPTNLLLGTFLREAAVNWKGTGASMVYQPKITGYNGVAVTHIFEYAGGTSLGFTGPGVNQATIKAGGTYMDFHVHTASADRKNMMDHGPMMFDNVLGVLTDLSGNILGRNYADLSNGDPYNIAAGDDVWIFI